MSRQAGETFYVTSLGHQEVASWVQLSNETFLV